MQVDVENRSILMDAEKLNAFYVLFQHMLPFMRPSDILAMRLVSKSWNDMIRSFGTYLVKGNVVIWHSHWQPNLDAMLAPLGGFSYPIRKVIIANDAFKEHYDKPIYLDLGFHVAIDYGIFDKEDCLTRYFGTNITDLDCRIMCDWVSVLSYVPTLRKISMVFEAYVQFLMSTYKMDANLPNTYALLEEVTIRVEFETSTNYLAPMLGLRLLFHESTRILLHMPLSLEFYECAIEMITKGYDIPHIFRNVHTVLYYRAESNDSDYVMQLERDSFSAFLGCISHEIHATHKSVDVIFFRPKYFDFIKSFCITSHDMQDVPNRWYRLSNLESIQIERSNETPNLMPRNRDASLCINFHHIGHREIALKYLAIKVESMCVDCIRAMRLQSTIQKLDIHIKHMYVISSFPKLNTLILNFSTADIPLWYAIKHTRVRHLFLYFNLNVVEANDLLHPIKVSSKIALKLARAFPNLRTYNFGFGYIELPVVRPLLKALPYLRHLVYKKYYFGQKTPGDRVAEEANNTNLLEVHYKNANGLCARFVRAIQTYGEHLIQLTIPKGHVEHYCRSHGLEHFLVSPPTEDENFIDDFYMNMDDAQFLAQILVTRN